jgi:hypothetical protein
MLRLYIARLGKLDAISSMLWCIAELCEALLSMKMRVMARAHLACTTRHMLASVENTNTGVGYLMRGCWPNSGNT